MFKFNLITDTDYFYGILEAKQQIASYEFYKLIESDHYGDDLKGIVIVLVCREPDITFKKRLRLSNKEKILYFDIVLDFDAFFELTHDQVISEICKIILTKVPPIVEKYKFKDFNLDKFMINLKYWFELNKFILKS